MANNLSSNITRKVMRAFIPAFEKQRVLSKTVNTQLFQGQFNPSSGDYVDIKRPHQYNAVRTSGGDISSSTWNVIVAGKATAQVQNYITVPIEWTNKEEALSLDQLEEILKPAAETACIELETSFCDFMYQRAALLSGTVGTAVDAWADVANPMSLMKALGVPEGMHHFIMNPFTMQNLAGAQSGLNAADQLVRTAWENAQIATPFAGLRALSSNSMSSYTSGACADREGAITDTAVDQTYVTHKDTMIQSIEIDGITASGVIKAGEMIEVEGRYYVHPRTGKKILDASGAPITWKGTVTADATASSGVATLLVSGPAIYEANGQYNNVDSAFAEDDVVNILGATATNYQPNLFYHKDAFAIAFVKLPKLFSTDTLAVTEDGIAIRVSKYSDGDANSQKIRFDLLPAFACLNPFFAGKAWGLT
jgi:hypothetical protein